MEVVGDDLLELALLVTLLLDSPIRMAYAEKWRLRTVFARLILVSTDLRTYVDAGPAEAGVTSNTCQYRVDGLFVDRRHV